MRQINSGLIEKIVEGLVKKANFILRPDIYAALKTALSSEKNLTAKEGIRAIIANADTAKNEGLAICQDTGLPVVFVELGQDVHIRGGSLTKAINQGIYQGYKQACLRNSVIQDPVLRGASGFIPAVIHTEIVAGDKVKLTVLPKGFGCENKSQLKMFRPTANVGQIKQFIVEAVKSAGPDACPPYVVGVGIGGTADYAGLLAKKGLLHKVTKSPRHQVTKWVEKLEEEALREINQLNIGPMGLGGKTTALAVNIEVHSTHIAGLPVAVNISCHALRSAGTVI